VRKTAISQQLYAMLPGCFCKAVDNRLGRIAYGKHAKVGFGMGFYTFIFQPFYHIMGRKLFKQAVKLFLTPGVKADQFPGFSACIGHITAPPARDTYLAQYVAAFFQYGYLVIRMFGRNVDSGEEAGGPAPADDHLFSQSLFFSASNDKVKG
jgi:hypothetical protein